MDGLDAADLARLRPNLKRVRLTVGEFLHPVGMRIEHVYFPESGMVSMLTVMKTGQQIETAIIGSEGVVGGWVALDGRSANTQSTVQMEGSAQQIPTGKFLELYNASDSFRSVINDYQGVILFQAQQSAACHAIHSVESRLCRWLLLSQDVIGSEHVIIDARISVAHDWRSKIISIAVRTLVAKIRLDPVFTRQNKNPGPQGSSRMRL